MLLFLKMQEFCSQENREQGTSLHATTIKDLSGSSIIRMDDKFSSIILSRLNPKANISSCSDYTTKTKTKNKGKGKEEDPKQHESENRTETNNLHL